MGKVMNRVADLVEAKKALYEQEGKKFTLQDMAYETKLAYNTLIKWVNNKVDRYDGETLATLCDYFGVEPGDILVYDRKAS